MRLSRLTDESKRIPEEHLILWLLEKGKILQDAGRYAESRQVFSEAENLMEEEYQKPESSVSSGILSVIGGRGQTNYRGSYSERITINIYQALNCLALGEFEEALTYCRKASARQEEAVTRFAKDIEASEKKAQEKQIDLDTIVGMDNLDKAYSNLDSYVSPAYANFENPMATYLRGLLFYYNESDRPSANVDLRKAFAMTPSNSFLKHEIENGAWEKWNPDAKTVYVILECGSAPEREELTLPLPSMVNGVSLLKLPTLRFHEPEVSCLSIVGNDGRVLQSELLASMDSVLATEFEKMTNTLVMTAVLNTVFKETAGQAVARKNKAAGFLAKTVLDAVYEPDLRSWRTIGSQFQIAHLPYPENGTLELSVLDKANRVHKKQTVTLPPSGSAVVYARSLSVDNLAYYSTALPEK